MPGDTLVFASFHSTIRFTISAILAVRQRLMITGTARGWTILMPRTTALRFLDIANLPPENGHDWL
jgi:hypothetical protein